MGKQPKPGNANTKENGRIAEISNHLQSIASCSKHKRVCPTNTADANRRGLSITARDLQTKTSPHRANTRDRTKQDAAITRCPARYSSAASRCRVLVLLLVPVLIEPLRGTSRQYRKRTIQSTLTVQWPHTTHVKVACRVLTFEVQSIFLRDLDWPRTSHRKDACRVLLSSSD